MGFLYRFRDIHCRQDREDIGLDKTDENLESAHNYHSNEGNSDDDPTLEHDDHEEKDQYNGMAGCHIGEETNGEGKWLCKLANDLNGNHDGNDKEGDAFRNEFFKIPQKAMFGHSRRLGTEEDDYRQCGRDVDIGCGRESTWNQAEEVTEENEEEESGDEGEPCQPLLSYGFKDEVSAKKVNEGLYQVLETRRNKLGPSPRHGEKEKCEKAGNPYHDDCLGDGEINAQDMDFHYWVKFEVVQQVH